MSLSFAAKCIAVCALAALAACDAAELGRSEEPAVAIAGEVDFSLEGPNEAALVVPVSINGRAPVNFILDTGATLTCVDVSLARVLALPEAGPAAGVAIGVMSSGRVETVRIDSLRIGSAVGKDLIACRLDLSALRQALGIQGLIGLNFLKSFDVGIDFDRRVLTLAPRE
jgi:predicted aspartyl protease